MGPPTTAAEPTTLSHIIADRHSRGIYIDGDSRTRCRALAHHYGRAVPDCYHYAVTDPHSVTLTDCHRCAVTDPHPVTLTNCYRYAVTHPVPDPYPITLTHRHSHAVSDPYPIALAHRHGHADRSRGRRRTHRRGH